MELDRRTFLTASVAGAAAAGAAPANATTPSSASGLDAAQFGLLPDVAADQSILLQRAVDAAGRARRPLLLPPAGFMAANVRLPSRAKIVGIRGATRIRSKDGSAIFVSDGADNLELSGLILDGRKTAANSPALVHLKRGADIHVRDCEIVDSGRNAIVLEQVSGLVSGCTISAAADIAIHSLDARGLSITGNIIRDSGNAGIQVWRSTPGDDGTFVLDNRIERTRAVAGGTGQNGNAVNVFRAGNVSVRGNRIHDAAFSAVRGNSASNLQITNNTCTQIGETALYAEFAFEGAVIANNTVDGAGIGVSVTNFNEGGRLAVVQGNILRRLSSGAGLGAGIAVEADTVVSGNIIEQAPAFGIIIGHGTFLRDVVVSGNIVRSAGIGIAPSVVPGAGTALIADNLISDAVRGAIVGLEWQKPATGDLARDGVGRHTHLTLANNRVR